METVDDLYYEKDCGWHNNVKMRWVLKDDVQKEFNNSLFPGDIVYFNYRLPKYSMVKLEDYLSSKGCTRCKKIEYATKVINDWNYYSNGFRISRENVDKPSEVPIEVALRHKSVFWTSIEKEIAVYLDSKRTRIEFDYSQYENLWTMYKSKDVDNYRLAAMVIMTVDWTDQMFLLHFLICQHQDKIRQSNYSLIPGWSDWANTIGISWKSHHVYAHQLVQLFKDYEITQEQIQLIHKLLNQ